MSQENLEKSMKGYQEDLQEKMEKGMHVPKSNFGKVMFGIALASFVAVTSLIAVNYSKHHGPQKFMDIHQTKGVAKITGITTFVEYREFEGISSSKFKVENGDIDLLIKGSIFGRAEAYLDAHSDGKVDAINYYDKKPTLHREKDYGQNKKVFDKASKDVVKYKAEFSK